MKDPRLLKAVINILTIEKIGQHLLTAVFFLFDIPGIGKPDIGPFFSINDEVMALLNLALFGLFLLSIIGAQRNAGWSLDLVMELAALDIVLEVLFHGLFFITVSVLVSVILIVAIFFLRRS
jgi:hypothetical protein